MLSYYISRNLRDNHRIERVPSKDSTKPVLLGAVKTCLGHAQACLKGGGLAKYLCRIFTEFLRTSPNLDRCRCTCKPILPLERISNIFCDENERKVPSVKIKLRYICPFVNGLFNLFINVSISPLFSQ